MQTTLKSKTTRRVHVRQTEPTPAEIAERCAAIQAGWSLDERLQRQSASSRLSNFVARISEIDTDSNDHSIWAA